MHKFYPYANAFGVSLFHIIYQSVSDQEWARSDLESLTLKSRAKNERLGLTGLLLYKNKAFIQTIEGEESVVRALFQTIANDPRHAIVAILSEGPIERRSYMEWSMGFRDVSQVDKAKVEGFNDLLNSDWSEVRLLEFPSEVKEFMKTLDSE